MSVCACVSVCMCVCDAGVLFSGGHVGATEGTRKSLKWV